MFLTPFCQGQNDSLTFEKHYTKSRIQLKKNIDSADIYLDKAYEVANHIKYHKGIAQCNLLAAVICSRRTNRKKGVEILKNNITYCDKHNLMKMKCKSLRNIASNYLFLNDFQSAENNLNEARNLAKKNKDTLTLSNIYFSLATLAEKKNNLELSVKYYLESVELDKLIDNFNGIQSTKSNMAIVYRKLGQYDKAKRTLLEIIETNDYQKKHNKNIYAYGGLASLYEDINDIKSAIKYFKKTDSLARKIKNKSGSAFANLKLSNLYTSMDRLEIAKVHCDTALVYGISTPREYKIRSNLAKINARLGNCIGLSGQIKEVLNVLPPNLESQEKIALYTDLSESYAKCNELSKAYSYLSKAFETRDTLYKENDKKRAADIEAKYQSSLKQAENEKLQQQNELQEAQLRTQKAYMLGGGGAAVMLGLLASLFYRQRRKQEQYNETLKAQNQKIDMLKREAIHRTNNHLNLATNLIAMQKSIARKTGAQEVIEDSERKLRAIAAANKRLSDTYDNHNNLKEVIDETVGYNIFNVADKKISYTSHVDQIAIDKSYFSIIALIVNELTTNSIKHAFHHEPSPSISVTVSQQSDDIILTYQDNGNFQANPNGNEGTALIEGLVDQLDGEMKVEAADGYRFTLIF